MKLFRSFLIVALAEPHRSDSWTLRLSDSPILGFSIDGLSDLWTLRLSDSPTLGLLDALYTSSLCFPSSWSWTLINFFKFSPTLGIYDSRISDSQTLRNYRTFRLSDSPTLGLSNSRMKRLYLTLTSAWMYENRIRQCWRKMVLEMFCSSLFLLGFKFTNSITNVGSPYIAIPRI